MDTHPTQDYSSSSKEEESAHYKKVISLGKKIVDEQNLDKTSDTLGRWMVHYIAELIEAAEADQDTKSENKTKCFEAILEFWRHRHSWPDGSKPFEQFDSILQTIKSICPENDNPFYFWLFLKKAIFIFVPPSSEFGCKNFFD